MHEPRARERRAYEGVVRCAESFGDPEEPVAPRAFGPERLPIGVAREMLDDVALGAGRA